MCNNERWSVKQSSLIEKNEHLKYNLDSLASFSGFNSKSTFYRVFKELEGITPSEFISEK